MFGNPEYTPGGHALHHACDIIIWLRPDSASKAVGGKDNPLGLGINAFCSKNRTAPPFKKSNYNIMFDGYLDENENLVEIAIPKGIIQKEGYKYTFNGKTVTDIKPFMESLGDEDWANIRKQLLECKTLAPAKEKKINDKLEVVID
jgi:hypothetical protein